MNKIKEKYGDQDEEERKLRMEILAVSYFHILGFMWLESTKESQFRKMTYIQITGVSLQSAREKKESKAQQRRLKKLNKGEKTSRPVSGKRKPRPQDTTPLPWEQTKLSTEAGAGASSTADDIISAEITEQASDSTDFKTQDIQQVEVFELVYSH